MGETSSLDILAIFVIPLYLFLLFALARFSRLWYLQVYFPEYDLEEKSKKAATKFHLEYGQSLQSAPSAYGQSFQSPSSANQGQQFFISSPTAGKVSNFKRLSPKSLLSPKREVSIRLNVPRDEWNDVKLIRRQELIELKRLYWGIDNPDLKFNSKSDLFQGSILPFERNDVVKIKCFGNMKYSLNDMFWYHDQWYFIKNHHTLLSQVLCDPDHPLKAMERSKLYIASQCLLFFATGLYLVMQGYAGLGVEEVLVQVLFVYPFMIAVEKFLWYVYSCPCMQRKTKTSCAASIYWLFEQCGSWLGNLIVIGGFLFLISGLILLVEGNAYLNTSDDYIIFTDRNSNVQEYTMIDWEHRGEHNPMENMLEYAKENIYESFSPAYIAYYNNETWNKGIYFSSGTFKYNGTTLSYHDGPEEDATLWYNILYYVYNSIFKMFIEFIMIYIIQFAFWKKEPVAIFVFGTKILHLNEWAHQWKLLDWRDMFFSEDEDRFKKYPPEKIIWNSRYLKIKSFYYEHKTFEDVQLELEKTIITSGSNNSSHNKDQTESASEGEEETTSTSLEKENKGIFNSLFKKNNQVAPTTEEIDATSQIEETNDTSTQESAPEESKRILNHEDKTVSAP